MWIIITIFAMLSIGPTVTTSAPPPDRTNQDGLASKVVAGDITAIVQAGNSGQKEFVPYLKDVLVRARADPRPVPGVIRALREALMKLDDSDTLQEYWCTAMSYWKRPAPEAFEGLGGWFSIQALDAILGGAMDARFMRAMDDDPKPAISVPVPEFVAVQMLRKVVPEAPGALTMDRDQWRNWIATHRSELQLRKPTGSAVIFTEAACNKMTLDGDW